MTGVAISGGSDISLAILTIVSGNVGGVLWGSGQRHQCRGRMQMFNLLPEEVPMSGMSMRERSHFTPGEGCFVKGGTAAAS